jgi:hypothetical protein
MPIPAQNDFLLPFLQALSDGQSVTRAQMTYRLAQHFGVSEDEAQHMSGHQFTLVSRVAWCDASNDLREWSTLREAVVINGELEIQDPAAAAEHQRFYRAVPMWGVE